MDGLIREAVERVTGESAEAFDWTESLTTADQIARVLRSGDGERGADLVFVTDHVNETVRELDPDLVALATSEPRVALGAELQTVLESPHGSDQYLDAPEVLLYGGPDRVRSAGGWHYGLSAEILEDIQRSCLPAGSRRVELHRVLAYCRENQIAHAISHPLDGHFVELPQVLRAISACRFIEAVNGGYGSDSTRRLLRYIALHNDTVPSSAGARSGPDGAREPSGGDAADIARWLAGRLAAPGPHEHVADGIIPWGGSDAHLGRYDRVCMMYRPPSGPGVPGIAELTRDMLETKTSALLSDRVFQIEGRGNGLGSVIGEVMRLVIANARRNASTFRGPKKFTRLLLLAPYLAVAEILRDRRQNLRLGALLDEVLERTSAERTRPKHESAAA